MPNTTHYDHDFFIAYAAQDSLLAEELAFSFRVFLDRINLEPGDVWDIAIAEAQFDSRCTIIIISVAPSDSHYLREEIATAIKLFKEHNRIHLIIPIYIGDWTGIKIPYGLNSIHGIHMIKWNLKYVAEVIRSANNHFTRDHVQKYDYADPKDFDIIEPERVVQATKSMMFLSERIEFEQFGYQFILRHRNNTKISYVFYCDVDGMSQINQMFGD